MLAVRGGIGGRPGDSLFDKVRGDLIVVGVKLPAHLQFRVITESGAFVNRSIPVPRGGLVHNDGSYGGRIVAVEPRYPHRIIWVTGPSASRPELLAISPFKAVRRYMCWRKGWRAKLRRLVGRT